jgi:hypothetical protein
MKKTLILVVIMFIFNCINNSNEDLYITGGPVIDRTHHFPADTLGTYDSTLTLQLFCDPILNEIETRINGSILTDFTVDGNSITYVKTIPTQEIQYELEIDSDLGEVYAICSIPEAFKIPEPPTLNIPFAEDCEIQWDKATYADYYDVSVYFFDTFPVHQHEWDTNYFFDDTSTVTIAGDQLIHTGTMIITIMAIHGARLLPGEEGNIQGDGAGFWIGKSITRRAVKVGSW